MKRLAYNVKKYLKIFFHLQKIGIMINMAYRWNFLLMILAVCTTFFSVIFIKVLFGFLKNIAGWNYYEALLVVASYMIIDGLMWVTCAYVETIKRHIRQGTLDGLLLKPIDAQFLVSVWRGDTEDFTRLVMGSAILAYALRNLNLPGNELAINLFLYLILLVAGFVVAYSFNLIIKTFIFWTIEGGAAFNVGRDLVEAAKYPTDIFYHKFVKIIFTAIIPLAFMATVPAKILARGFDWRLMLGALFTATAFFTTARVFWKFALRRYSSASS